MQPAGPSQYAEVAEVFAALASPVRSALVHHLTTGPKTVGALVESLELSQPLVSQHLRILRGARLDHFDMIVDAAIAGLGIGIVPEIVARPALDRGALALAAPRRFETGESYALILPEPARQSPHVQRFRNWLLREIAA